MTDIFLAPHDDTLDLVLDRQVAAPRGLLWRALTEPELLKKWLCPRPWGLSDCRVDLRVGGEFYTVMTSPDGDEFPGSSCYLDIVPGLRLVWTSTMRPGFRPAPPAEPSQKECDTLLMTCVITLDDKDGGTHYVARILHNTPEQTKAHEAMGFHDGWGTAFEQMLEVIEELR